MSTGNIRFSNGADAWHMSEMGLRINTEEFKDLTRDMSISVLYGASGYGPALVPQLVEMAQSAKIVHHDRGGMTVHINGMKIFQNARGDLMVHSGPKYLRMSAITGNMHLQTQFICMDVENTCVKIRRGGQKVLYSSQKYLVSDGVFEAGFAEMGRLVYQPHRIFTKTVTRANFTFKDSYPRPQPYPSKRNNSFHTFMNNKVPVCMICSNITFHQTPDYRRTKMG